MKNNTRNLYKRDRRRSFDGTVVLKDKTYEEIMHLPDEYLQSMVAEYGMTQKFGYNRLAVDKILTEKHAPYQYNEAIYVRMNDKSLFFKSEKEDAYQNLSSSIYYTFMNKEKVEVARQHVPGLVKAMFGLSDEEFDNMVGGTDVVLRFLLDLTINRHFGETHNVNSEKRLEFFKEKLGTDLDLWTRICTGDKVKVYDNYRRFVPASEEFGTPEFIINYTF